jgi:hypothetical protein
MEWSKYQGYYYQIKQRENGIYFFVINLPHCATGAYISGDVYLTHGEAELACLDKIDSWNVG